MRECINEAFWFRDRIFKPKLKKKRYLKFLLVSIFWPKLFDSHSQVHRLQSTNLIFRTDLQR